MNLQKYQSLALQTAIYPNVGNNTLYPALGLCGESGELCEKLKKIQRDKGGIISEEDKTLLLKEVGDVCWYLAAIYSELRMQLPDTDLIIEDEEGQRPSIPILCLWVSVSSGVIASDASPYSGLPINTLSIIETTGILIVSLAGICQSLGSNLPVVLEANIAKLQSRQERGVLQGSGDTR
jgi:hypothetical protein